MKRPRSSSGNPSVVLSVFAPETEFSLSLDGWILLEALDSPFATGGKPTTYDLVLAALVMTDESAVLAARRKGTLEELMSAHTAGKRPADVMGLAEPIAAAIAAAFLPVDHGAASEKKSPAAPAGG